MHRHSVTVLPMNGTQDANNWRQVLREQGRTLAWLAKATGTNVRSVYAYSQGQNRPPEAWLRKASDALGEEVTR